MSCIFFSDSLPRSWRSLIFSQEDHFCSYKKVLNDLKDGTRSQAIYCPFSRSLIWLMQHRAHPVYLRPLMLCSVSSQANVCCLWLRKSLDFTRIHVSCRLMTQILPNKHLNPQLLQNIRADFCPLVFSVFLIFHLHKWTLFVIFVW